MVVILVWCVFDMLVHGDLAWDYSRIANTTGVIVLFFFFSLSMMNSCFSYSTVLSLIIHIFRRPDCL